MTRNPAAKALRLCPTDPRPLPYRQATFLRLRIVPRSSTSDLVHSSGRRMSSTGGTAKKNEYLVIIPDHANSLQKRLAVRPKHFEGLAPHIASGSVVFGGATLSRQPDEGETLDMNGSAMLIKAEDE